MGKASRLRTSLFVSFRVIQSRRLRWAGDVVRIYEGISPFKMLQERDHIHLENFCPMYGIAAHPATINIWVATDLSHSGKPATADHVSELKPW